MIEIQNIKKTIIVCLILALILGGINLFVVKIVVVSGVSMENNYLSGEYLLVNRLAYKTGKPQHGDVVVCRNDGHLIIKRIIALGGDEIEIKNGKTFLNGKELDEFYIKEEMKDSFPKTEIPEGEIFLMGDNRNESIDCRILGPLQEDSIIGRVKTLQDEFGEENYE